MHYGYSRAFTKFEDNLILEYILNNDAYLQVKGVLIWKHLAVVLSEENGVERSWQSLKERFIKRIIRKLDDYKIPPNSMAKLLQPFSPRERDCHKVKRRRNMRCYSQHEDKAILQYVLNHPTERVKGNCMWKELERTGIVEGRSWESLKNRFLKHLVGDSKNLLKPEAAEKIKRIVKDDLDFVVYDTSEDERVSSTRRKVTHRGVQRELAEMRFSDLHSTSEGPASSVSDKLATSCSSDSNSETDDSEPLLVRRKKRLLVKSDSEDQLSDTQSPTPCRSNPESLIRDAGRSKTGVDNDGVTSNVTPLFKRIPVVLLPRCDETSTECHREEASSPRGIDRPVPLEVAVSRNENLEIKVESEEVQGRDVSGNMILFLAEDEFCVDPITDTLFDNGIVEMDGKMICLDVPNFPCVHPVFY